MSEPGGDVEMLVGISKHLANLSDNKKQRVSTTAISMQETLKDKLVSVRPPPHKQMENRIFFAAAKI